MEIEPLTPAFLVALACVASAYDVATRTIPNRVTVAGFLAGLVLASAEGPAVVGIHLFAALVVLLVCLPLFMLGALGGGDVKLLAAVAMLLGPGPLPHAVALAALAGALIALAEASRRRVLLPLAFEASDSLAYYATLGRRGRPGRRVVAASLTVPYGLAIGIGAVAACFV